MQRMNLLPDEYIRKLRGKTYINKLLALWAFIFVILIGFIAAVGLTESSISARLAMYNDAADKEYEKAMAVAAELNGITARANELSEVIDQLTVRKKVDIDYVLIVQKLIPDEINVSTLTADSETMKIEGFSPKAETIAGLYNRLNDSGLFSQIIISKISKENSAIAFTMNADLKKEIND